MLSISHWLHQTCCLPSGEIETLHLIDGHPDESSILKFPFAATFTHVQLAIISHVNRSLTAGQSGFRQPDAGPHIPERIATPISDIVAIAGHPKIMAGASIVIIRAANRVGQNFSMLTIEAPTGFDDLLKGARIEVFPAVFLVQRAAATRRGVVSGAPKGCLDVGISELGAFGVGSGCYVRRDRTPSRSSLCRSSWRRSAIGHLVARFELPFASVSGVRLRVEKQSANS